MNGRQRLTSAANKFLLELDAKSVEQGGDAVFREYLYAVENPEQPLVDFAMDQMGTLMHNVDMFIKGHFGDILVDGVCYDVLSDVFDAEDAKESLCP